MQNTPQFTCPIWAQRAISRAMIRLIRQFPKASDNFLVLPRWQSTIMALEQNWKPLLTNLRKERCRLALLFLFFAYNRRIDARGQTHLDGYSCRESGQVQKSSSPDRTVALAKTVRRKREQVEKTSNTMLGETMRRTKRVMFVGEPMVFCQQSTFFCLASVFFLV